jgi:hypothetical protein
LTLVQQGSLLRTRIFNRTGHKLPTGFPDGRRIWINVRFLNCNDELLVEHGHYDFETADLTTNDTTVYEALLGIEGTEYAQSIGQAEGHTFNFVVANTIIKDNRIPTTTSPRMRSVYPRLILLRFRCGWSRQGAWRQAKPRGHE